MNPYDKLGRFLSTVSFLMSRGENFLPSPWGDKVYLDRANRHAVTIKAKPQQVYQALIDFSEMQRWCPQDKIVVEKITPGKFGVGTKMRYRLNCHINPIWNSVVVDLEENS
jgi:hypothetical protein